MKTLYESLLGDVDDIVDKTTVHGFLDSLKGGSLNDVSDAVVNSDGSISGESLFICHTKIPKYIKFKNCEYVALSACEIEDIYETFNGGENDRIHLQYGCVIRGTNRKLKKACSELIIKDCIFDDSDWIPNDIDKLTLEKIDTNIGTIDLKGKKLEKFYLDDVNVSSIINADAVLDEFHVVNCPKLKKIDNIKAHTVIFKNVKKLTDIKFSNGVELLRFMDSSLKHLSPDILPSTIVALYAGRMGEEWIEDNVKKICPKLSQGEFPSPDEFKFKNSIKVGDWVVIKGKARTTGIYGSSRGDLMVDKVVKVTDSRVKGEEAGLRPFMDVEPMIDANPKKNWKYVDPNGINDITGVGIEVGDKVAVYLPSGYGGRNNGIISDEVVKLTKAGVKCKEAGNRRPYDICILRSQEECNKQFK